MLKLILPLTALFALGSAAFAGPLTFDFTFADVIFDTGATAVGQVTIDSATLATDLALNTGLRILPITDLEALTVTVSGATAGNGTFGLADFVDFKWWSAGANFDYSQNLVGQPTAANAWGTPDGNSGDFIFFGARTSPTAPDAVLIFTLAANGDTANLMRLTSLKETPEPGAMGLAALGGIAMFAISRRRVRSSL